MSIEALGRNPPKLVGRAVPAPLVGARDPRLAQPPVPQMPMYLPPQMPMQMYAPMPVPPQPMYLPPPVPQPMYAPPPVPPAPAEPPQREIGSGWREKPRGGAHGSRTGGGIADRFTAYREEEMFVFPGAHEAIDRFKALGIKLALVTNGAADMQRAKVERFALGHRFDHIQIEGEHGFGKPEERAYLHAMDALGVTAADTWMIGDNLEWEVVAPQRLGIYAIWMDVHGVGLPPGSTIKPDRIIRSLTELVPAAQ